MKSLLSLFAVVTASLALILGGMDVAEAGKRFGSGQSFGSKFGQSQNLKKDSSVNNSSMSRQQATPAQQKNADRKSALAGKGGLMGILGGLAIGGLLGALFFGGAFENINFFDILIFGLIAFLLFKLLAGRSRQQQQPAGAGAYGEVDMGNDTSYQRSNTAREISGSSDEFEGQTVNSLRGSALPKDFDEADFIEGAKNCFVRLQKAWDEGDLADIREFTTDHVFAEIQDQLHARSERGQTEIISLEGELLSAQDLGSKKEAIVLFKAELTEDGNRVEVEEVWHFVKTTVGRSWQLEGIQQVEG